MEGREGLRKVGRERVREEERKERKYKEKVKTY